jgi:hypothetical protein
MFREFLVALIVAIPLILVPALLLSRGRKLLGRLRKRTGQVAPKPPG